MYENLNNYKFFTKTVSYFNNQEALQESLRLLKNARTEGKLNNNNIPKFYEEIPKQCLLKNNIIMRFSSEPDIAFEMNNELIVVIKIKGGTDPAGALERYGTATKSFQHSIEINKKCKNIYLFAIFTKELERRIK